MSGGPVYLHHDEHGDAAWLWHQRGPHSPWGAEQIHAAGGVGRLPRIAVLLIGDGRDEIRSETLTSFAAQVSGYQLGGVVYVDDRRHSMGFGGAIRHGWEYLSVLLGNAQASEQSPPFDFVFHLEEDWAFPAPINVRHLAQILASDIALAQCALRRGPVNAVERAAGGLVEMWPDEYREAGVITPEGAIAFLQHQLYFTTNPSLYRTSLTLLGWPEGERSEEAFTRRCLQHGFSFASFGPRGSPPSIEHLGHERTGTGY